MAIIPEAFVLGLLTPLVAACVLPLYPGFLAYVAGQLSGAASRWAFALIGAIVTAGVILFMLLVGLVFTLLLEKSLTSVIQVVSPVAFAILLAVSIMLIFNVDFARIFPKANVPMRKNPLASAFSFGFFFGAIVIPCNPAFIIVLLTRATLSAADFVTNLIAFVAFGVGIGFPLLAFSLLSSARSSSVISFLTARRRVINLVAGILMFLVSLYYLVVVFSVFGDAVAASPLGASLSFLFSWIGVFVP